MQVTENGKPVRVYEPAPRCAVLVSDLASTSTNPTLPSDGRPLDPHDSYIGIEVGISGGDGTSVKGIKLWLFSRGLMQWHAPEESIVTDLHLRPGMRIFYVLADPILYERAYLQVTQNGGAGTINANIISR